MKDLLAAVGLMLVATAVVVSLAYLSQILNEVMKWIG